MPPSLENREDGAAPGGRGDPSLEDVGGQDLRRGSGGPGGEVCDGQHHSRVRPGRGWRPLQEEEGLICEGHFKGYGGLEEKEMPGCSAEVLEQLVKKWRTVSEAA